jgi:hypothetical protein
VVILRRALGIKVLQVRGLDFREWPAFVGG